MNGDNAQTNGTRPKSSQRNQSRTQGDADQNMDQLDWLLQEQERMQTCLNSISDHINLTRQGNRNPAGDSLKTNHLNSGNQFRLLRNQIDPPQTNNTRHDDHGQFNLIRKKMSGRQSASAEQTLRNEAVHAVPFNSVHNQIYSEPDRIRRNKREYKNLHSLHNQNLHSEGAREENFDLIERMHEHSHSSEVEYLTGRLAELQTMVEQLETSNRINSHGNAVAAGINDEQGPDTRRRATNQANTNQPAADQVVLNVLHEAKAVGSSSNRHNASRPQLSNLATDFKPQSNLAADSRPHSNLEAETSYMAVRPQTTSNISEARPHSRNLDLDSDPEIMMEQSLALLTAQYEKNQEDEILSYPPSMSIFNHWREQTDTNTSQGVQSGADVQRVRGVGTDSLLAEGGSSDLGSGEAVENDFLQHLDSGGALNVNFANLSDQKNEMLTQEIQDKKAQLEYLIHKSALHPSVTTYSSNRNPPHLPSNSANASGIAASPSRSRPMQQQHRDAPLTNGKENNWAPLPRVPPSPLPFIQTRRVQGSQDSDAKVTAFMEVSILPFFGQVLFTLYPS